MKKLPNLDPLRFFLAMLVMLFHIPKLSKNQGLPYFNDLPIFHKGTEAVYMFFVLSGFLIIRLIYKELIIGQFSIRNFYMRRILRIMPLYYLIVVFGFFYYNALLPFFKIPFEITYDIKTGILLTGLFLPNVLASYQPGGILEILWSIGVEEQFYLGIAPLLFFLPKKMILKALIFLFTIYIALFHFSGFEFLRNYQFVYFLMVSGGIISILEEKNKLNFLKNNKIIAIGIVVVTLLFFSTNIFLIENQFVYNLIICTLFSLFIYVISYANFGFIIENKILNYCGKISYGMYMYHAIVMNLVVYISLKIKESVIIPNAIIVLLIYLFTIGITIGVSAISFKYFESYFLKKKGNYKN